MHNHVKYARVSRDTYKISERGDDLKMHAIGFVYRRHRFSDEHRETWVADANMSGVIGEGVTRRGAVQDMLGSLHKH